ncbi:hypothetical protein B0J11DRAFT_312104 [Dendryphion nanum]|uniref:Uncharacterized protein n=1 Tax=Dendryphion nanum TaxID=256645 RepID=A0A9P9DTE9_9PLEO|nr:hypothetical protein B0J11DRAFT_312104 [Dendryphion nanum]
MYAYVQQWLAVMVLMLVLVLVLVNGVFFPSRPMVAKTLSSFSPQFPPSLPSHHVQPVQLVTPSPMASMAIRSAMRRSKAASSHPMHRRPSPALYSSLQLFAWLCMAFAFADSSLQSAARPSLPSASAAALQVLRPFGLPRFALIACWPRGPGIPYSPDLQSSHGSLSLLLLLLLLLLVFLLLDRSVNLLSDRPPQTSFFPSHPSRLGHPA